MRLALLLLLSLATLGGCSGFQVPEQPSFYRDIAQGGQLDAEAAASMISGYRKNNGLTDVTLDPDLSRMAQAQAEAMAKRDKLEHNIKTPFVARLKASGYNAKSAAEKEIESRAIGSGGANGSIAAGGDVAFLIVPLENDVPVPARHRDRRQRAIRRQHSSQRRHGRRASRNGQQKNRKLPHCGSTFVI